MIFSPRDYVVYGLVMLGLIVAPTAIFNREGITLTLLHSAHNVTTDLLYSTPLFCNLCSKPNQCANLPATAEDPGHHMWYVKTFCTHKDLGKFTVRS